MSVLFYNDSQFCMTRWGDEDIGRRGSEEFLDTASEGGY